MKILLTVEKYTIEGMLRKKGFYIYTNIGTSMLPLIRERRDLIEIRPIRGRVKKYQVALYKKAGVYILHRCISVNSDGYVFAGDNNCFKEYDVTDNMILGVMTRIIRNGKTINLSGIFYKLYCFAIVDLFSLKCVALQARTILCASLGRLSKV